jgi:23S rRNA pseudouridine1911/1915/1917 synthase
MDQNSKAFKITAEAPDAGKRLDFLISSHLPDCSRNYAAELVRKGLVRVGGCVKKAAYRVQAGDRIQGKLPPAQVPDYAPEPIPLAVLFEDEALIVINKQPGLVVHPAPGHPGGTLVNALLHHCPPIEAIGGELRPGIVHRLDRDTSGTLVIAKTASVLEHLAHQFKSRQVKKEYLALVHGTPREAEGVLTLPIGRHPVDRKRMSTRSRKSRHAETHWRIQARYGGLTLLRVRIKTGRTHQIRVHCAAMRHPVVGDAVYGGRKSGVARAVSLSPAAARLVEGVSRQMLHAWRLTFTHPLRQEEMMFESPLPPDMGGLVAALRALSAGETACPPR